ncbi:tyrosine-type recombinase/integrase [Cryobacterium sp. TMT3-29-2]|uniref:tyrosine-type recombinase/integrase n=1 Tax=Cryobacterium sp. TMT3-29-2 TaxID=2555867 RepID=UPI00107352AE|nr:tyrosine-type recombinase/integrase [Cryobacterium sp. TMT3-29-2]TFC86952.1 integrase [Cryobacterium sp. TMT3-29-2]
MGKPQIPAGELGKIGVKRLPSGRYRARASTRDDSGALHRLGATAEIEERARTEVGRQAMALSTGGFGSLAPSNTVADAVELWLPQILTRAKTGSLTYSTYESYETTARLVILPRCGGVQLDRLTVGRCDRILQKILEEESILKARHARADLSLICGYAVRDDAMGANPVRDVQRLPTTPKKESTLTTVQITTIRKLMQQWRITREDGPRPNYRILIDGMEIMLGTSIRIGECLGLRRCDVDMTTLPPTLVVNGTIVSTKAEGIHRKASPKRSRQRRSIALPSMAAAAVRRRLALADPDPEASLFATKSGHSLSVSNYERLLRSLIADERANLVKLGVDVDEYTTHIYRRTAATLIERAAGITLASRLLGHANEQTTRNSYIVTADLVDPVTAEILDAVLGG